MDKNKKDQGVLFALVERFQNQRLPRTLRIKEHVDAGGLLTEDDLHFLEEVNKDGRSMKLLVDKHPEWLELYTKAVHLHNEITKKALENEKAHKKT